MNCKELMVGDLVYIHEPKCKGHRVDYINELDGQVGADGEVYDECDIRPIPLTEEILVKNGFEKSERWHYLTTKISNIKITIQLGYSGKIDYVRVLEQNEIQPFTTYYLDAVFNNIHYVHQLQHLLRLVGIEKEIEL